MLHRLAQAFRYQRVLAGAATGDGRTAQRTESESRRVALVIRAGGAYTRLAGGGWSPQRPSIWTGGQATSPYEQ